MDFSFYTTVSVVAFVVLMIVLVILGIVIAYPSHNTAPFPPTTNTCPDYWTTGSLSLKQNRCYMPRCGVNTGGLCDHNGKVYTGNDYVHKDDKGLYYIDVSKSLSTNPLPFCSFNDWATLHNISWNGVSNTNQC